MFISISLLFELLIHLNIYFHIILMDLRNFINLFILLIYLQFQNVILIYFVS